ncbi:hypothetical protein H9P43_008525 [Blastocladiella emersonii ATCC 22665]|nr:hypothetical protein H9P43_008525 [Blastocladiella emersonii ATCC 22665]
MKLYPSYLITGASSGIGRALALELAQRAAKLRAPLALALTARRVPVLEEVKRDVLAVYPEARVHVQRLDVTLSFETIRAAYEACHAALGGVSGIHCFVINAGISGRPRAVGSDEIEFDADRQVAMTNFVAAITCIDAAVRYIRDHGVHQTREQAHVVGISSLAGQMPLPFNAVYSATKAGLDQYLRSLRVETRGEGIHVSTLQPGFVDTPINDWMLSRPMVCTAAHCAVAIADRIAARTAEAAVPWWPWAILKRLAPFIPDFVLLKNAKDMLAETKAHPGSVGGGGVGGVGGSKAD